jgi:hypothetical protein
MWKISPAFKEFFAIYIPNPGRGGQVLGMQDRKERAVPALGYKASLSGDPPLSVDSMVRK